MGFSTQKGSSSRTTMSEINVTPLVDVMLVLLIMFMVTTPLMQQGIDVNLPKTKSSGVAPKENPVVIVVNRNQTIEISEQKVSTDELESKLKTLFKNNKEPQVYIQADKAVDYGFVAEVMALIRAAGVFNIGLVTLPKEN
jgi:biopolymer transport protein TolR